MIRLYQLTLIIALILSEVTLTQALLENTNGCCRRTAKTNETYGEYCDPGCHCVENNTVLCVPCESLSLDLENLTVCNSSTQTSVSTKIPIGGPGVAASVLLGTLSISLFSILSVASFFYLKRSNRLPALFYGRKAFVFRPSETAVMMPATSSSVRKPRYVRRERPSVAAAASRATVPVGAVTKVYDVDVQ